MISVEQYLSSVHVSYFQVFCLPQRISVCTLRQRKNWVSLSPTDILRRAEVWFLLTKS